MTDIQENEARVNVTYGGQNGELPDPVLFDSTDGDVKGWVTEAVRTGGVPGIAAQQANFADFVVDRFTATQERPYNYIMIRPKTPFGGDEVDGGDSLPGKKKGGKALGNTNAADAQASTSDIQIFGDPNAWELIAKASSQKQGWMKSTKRMKVHGGYLYQVTTEFQDQNSGGVRACAEALCFVPVPTVGGVLQS